MPFRASLSDVREFDRAVFVVAAARFVNVLGSGIVHPVPSAERPVRVTSSEAVRHPPVLLLPTQGSVS